MARWDHEAEKERFKRELAEKQARRQEEPFLPPLELADGTALHEPTLLRMQRRALREHLKSLVERVAPSSESSGESITGSWGEQGGKACATFKRTPVLLFSISARPRRRFAAISAETEVIRERGAGVGVCCEAYGTARPYLSNR